MAKPQQFERFFYDPHMDSTGGGVRWENSLILSCDPETGRAVARRLNAVLLGERDIKTIMDVAWQIKMPDAKNISVDFGTGMAVSKVTLPLDQWHTFMRMMSGILGPDPQNQKSKKSKARPH